MREIQMWFIRRRRTHPLDMKFFHFFFLDPKWLLNDGENINCKIEDGMEIPEKIEENFFYSLCCLLHAVKIIQLCLISFNFMRYFAFSLIFYEFTFFSFLRSRLWAPSSAFAGLNFGSILLPPSPPDDHHMYTSHNVHSTTDIESRRRNSTFVLKVSHDWFQQMN